MAQIGTFTRDEDGSYTGTIRTLSLDIKVRFVPTEPSQNDKAPDLRVLAGNVELGAAWKRSRARLVALTAKPQRRRRRGLSFEDHAHTSQAPASSLFIPGWFLPTAGQFPTRSSAQRRVGSALSDFDAKERASLRAIAQLALNGRHPSASSTELRACMNLVLSVEPKLTHAVIWSRPAASHGRFR